ncbi:MAG: cytochrome b N-terminal domain-containing protein [Spirochaetia bacterium]|nr:cytochrome b N-terminal domain-containing protein [Spirochaetia bacterium]
MKEKLSEQLYSPNKFPKEIYIFRFVYKWLRLMLEKITESKYNPVANAGTLAVLFFSVVMVSGLYLIFFYRLASPYESIVAMQDNSVFIRWVRALHRYASDAAVVAILIHMLKMLAQGRSWGPRILSWISGVVMTGLLFFSAYTGYVLVWDEHAKIIGITGLKIMDIIPVMPESLLRTFSGEKLPGDSFFFFVVFIHLAVPLIMIFGIWLHTSRISLPKYFFNWKTTVFYIGLFIAASVMIPAPLLQKADLFSTSLHFPVDAFFSFFLYFPVSLKPAGFLFLLLGFNVLLLAIPWYFKPSVKIRKEDYVSMVDLELCHGCKQCYYDCPFDAIDMTESVFMKQKELIAKAESSMIPVVNAIKCVSCGLCAASCSTFAIGPTDRTSRDLLHLIRELEESSKEALKKYFIFACSHNDNISLSLHIPDSDVFMVSCTGVIHSTHLHHVARHYEKTIVLGCLDSNCTFRKGPEWLHQRIDGNRAPRLMEADDRDNIIRVNDFSQLSDAIKNKFILKNSNVFQSFFSSRPIKTFIAMMVGLLLITGITAISRLSIDQEHDQGMLKLSWKMQGEYVEKCHEYTAAEIKSIPVHMRKKNACQIYYLSYLLKIKIDDNETILPYKPGGFRHDRPMLVYEELNLATGDHFIDVEFKPLREDEIKSAENTLHYKSKIKIEKNKIILLTINNGQFMVKNKN